MLVHDFSLLFYFIMCFFCLNLVLLFSAFSHFMVILIFLDMLLLLNVFLSCVAALLVVGPEGYIYAFFILGTAAADTAVGLGLFILYYKSTGSVSL